jgi:hypothetical protein
MAPAIIAPLIAAHPQGLLCTLGPAKRAHQSKENVLRVVLGWLKQTYSCRAAGPCKATWVFVLMPCVAMKILGATAEVVTCCRFGKSLPGFDSR